VRMSRVELGREYFAYFSFLSVDKLILAAPSYRGVNDTREKFTGGAVDTGEQFIAGVSDS
jgi:hypothetical protein